MKKAQRKPDLRKEYEFDYTKAKPNRFAAKLGDATVVVLDPDVAEVFTSSKSVNKALRSTMSAKNPKPAATADSRKPRPPKHRAA